MWVPLNVSRALLQLGIGHGDQNAVRDARIPADWVKMEVTRASLRAVLEKVATEPRAQSPLPFPVDEPHANWDPCPYALLGPFLDDRCGHRCGVCTTCKGFIHPQRLTPCEAVIKLCEFLEEHAPRRLQLDGILRRRASLKV